MFYACILFASGVKTSSETLKFLVVKLKIRKNTKKDGRKSNFMKTHPLNLLVAFVAGLASTLNPIIARADILYMSNADNNTIEKFTPGGVGSVFASSGLNLPGGLAFDSAGNLFVANSGDNTIEKFTMGGVGSVFASSGLNAPAALAFDNSGNLYAANAGGTTIEKFTPGGVGSEIGRAHV